MNVALVYDRVNKWGGAERVLLALHELFPDAPLFTAVYDKKNARWADVFSVRPSFLQKIPGAKNNHELFPWLTPLAFEQFNFDEYDVVLSVTSAEAKSIITKPKTLHICYCLTPTRYLWSHYSTYFQSKFAQIILSPIISLMRSTDQIMSRRPDFYVAISKEVKSRIQKYYHQESDVLYPPVSVPFTTKSVKPSVSPPKNFFLVVSRLVTYKSVDIVIEACNALQIPLVIIGSGREEAKLNHIAGPTIEFYRDLTDDSISWYYENCRALIVPQHEDFGLVSVEVQSVGKPVIAFKSGGSLETVKDGKTGIFFEKQTKESIIGALLEFEHMTFDKADCIKNAQTFSKDRFKKEFKMLVDKLMSDRA